MRYRLIFNLKNRGEVLPFHHQQVLAEVFYEIIRRELPEKYHKYAFFNFSGVKGQTKVSRKGLHYLSNKVTIVISSLSMDFINRFVEAIYKRDLVEVGDLLLQPDFVEKENTPEFHEEVKYVCISPIVVAPKGANGSAKAFIHPSEEEFSDLLFDSVIHQIENSGLYSLEKLQSLRKFQFVPDSAYLEKINSTRKKFSRIYQVAEGEWEHEIRGYTLPFTLIAAPEVHDFIFLSGLGSYTTHGFGMLDLANKDPLERTKRLEVAELKYA